MHRNCHQGNRSLLSRRHQHVELTFGGTRIHVPRHFKKHIGLLAHCRKYDNDVISFFIILDTALCHIENSFLVGNRCTTKFFHD